MKKRIFWLSLAFAAGSASHAFAQGAADALRYSQLQFGGPARTQGIGGANTALGADFGNLTSNPAGLGLYQKSEFHFTPGLGLGQSDARMEGNASAAVNETKNSFHIASLGLVIGGRRADSDQSSDWRGGSFAFGFTRIADFNTASNYNSTLTNRSIAGPGGSQTITGDDQSYLASLRGPRNFTSIRNQGNSGDYTSLNGLAYGAYLTSILKTRRQGAPSVDSTIVSRVRRGPIQQSERIVSKGSMSQLDFGYGANFRDRLYLGVGVGLVSSNFRQVRDLTEVENDPTTHLSNYTLHEDLQTKGSGLNLRIGAIYRLADAVRLGASIQTPTWMHLTDTYNASITTEFTAQGNDVVSPSLPTGPVGVSSVETVPNDYAYTLTTPFRASGGAAITLGKHGFLTGDVEYVGYGQARLHNDAEDANGDDYTFTVENADIQNRYKSTVNLRAGAEGRFDVFRLRAGYARYGDPYKADSNNERVQNFYTAGAGIRQGNFFLDAAVVYTTFNQQYTPYDLDVAPLIKVNNNRYTTSVTAGFTF